MGRVEPAMLTACRQWGHRDMTFRYSIIPLVLFILGCANTEPIIDAPALVPDSTIAGCNAGETRCIEGFEEVCGSLGLWTRTRERGECDVDLCADARRTRSYIGCEYWPVDLDNAIEVLADKPDGRQCRNLNFNFTDQIRVCEGTSALGGLCDVGDVCPAGYQCRTRSACILNAQRSPYSIVVSNPSNSVIANLVLTDGTGHSATMILEPNAVEKIYPSELGLDDLSIDHTSLSRRAYRLTSDAPINLIL